MTITGLEECSGVARRTIHFYVKEGLLPPPSKPGGGARYGNEHLLRLLLIRECQREHYKLQAIRERLDAALVGASAAQVKAQLGQLLSAGAPQAAPRGSVQDLERFLSGTHPAPASARSARDSSRDPRQGGAVGVGSFSFKALAKAGVQPSLQAALRGDKAGPELASERSGFASQTWVRFSPAEGVEVQVQEEVLRRKRREVLRWLASFDKSNEKERGS